MKRGDEGSGNLNSWLYSTHPPILKCFYPSMHWLFPILWSVIVLGATPSRNALHQGN
jgi:hypothetical protein